jgi:hypothetical protein
MRKVIAWILVFFGAVFGGAWRDDSTVASRADAEGR